MKEIGKGIYCCGRDLIGLDKPLVLVHPWYEEENFRFRGLKSGLGRINFFHKENYGENILNLLRSSGDRNIFLFEGSKTIPYRFRQEDYLADIEETAMRVSNLRRNSDGLYVIQTYPGDSSFRYSSDEQVFNFLGNFSKHFDLAGGRFSMWSHARYCAGNIYFGLIRNGFKIDVLRNCCFE